MILKIQNYLSPDLTRYVLIGDTVSGIQAGKASGVGANLLLAVERPINLSSRKYELIAILHEAMTNFERAPQ